MANTVKNTINKATLGRSTTQKFFKTEDGYQKMTERWSSLTNDKESRAGLTASHHLLYLILRGKDLTRSFSPVTSEKKLANGASKWGGYRAARSGLVRYDWAARTYALCPAALAVFDGLLDNAAVSEFVLAHLDGTEPAYKEVAA